MFSEYKQIKHMLTFKINFVASLLATYYYYTFELLANCLPTCAQELAPMWVFAQLVGDSDPRHRASRGCVSILYNA